MVLLLGQYSVGKTSFIRSLLQRDFPGQRVGPEPTTDRFMAVMHGNEERLVPGHALAMQVGKSLGWLVGWLGYVHLWWTMGADGHACHHHNLIPNE